MDERPGGALPAAVTAVAGTSAAGVPAAGVPAAGVGLRPPDAVPAPRAGLPRAARPVGLLLALAVAAGWFAAVALTGSGVAHTGRWMLAVLLAVLVPGYVLARSVRRVPGALVEDLAWAVPSGCLVALAGWLVDRSLPFAPGGDVFGPLVTAALLAVRPLRRRVLARPLPGWGAGPALVLGGTELVAIGWMLRTGLLAYRPVPAAAGTTYYPDIMYNLALAGQLDHHIAPTYPPVAGATLSYHWFLFAITDHLTTHTGVGLFDATLRLGPASLVPAIVLLVAVVARRLAGRVWAGPLAAVLLGAVELSQASRWTTEDGSLGMLPRAWFTSTPQALGWVAGLAAAGAAIGYVRRRGADRSIPVALLVPFLALAAGAKSPVLAVLGGGLAVAFGASVLRRSWGEVRRCLAAGLACGAVFVAADYTIYQGSSYGIRLRPFAAALDRVPQMFPGYDRIVSPLYIAGRHYAWAAVATESLLWLLPLVPRLAGLVFRVRYHPDAAGWFCAGTAATGVLLAMLVGHPAGSEVYFMQSGYPIGVAGAAAGLVLAFDRMRVRHRALAVRGGALVALGLVAAAGVARLQPLHDPVRTWRDRYALAAIAEHVPVLHLAWQWARPTVMFLAVLAAVGLGALLVVRCRALSAGLAVLAVALGAGVFTMVLTFHGTTEPVQGSPAAVTADDRGLIAHGVLPTLPDAFAAGAYVNAHAGADDVVATNMYCRYDRAARAAGLAGCDARNFVASALTGRSTLVGGWAYSDRAVSDAWSLRHVSYKNQPFWNRVLFDEQFDAVVHPTAALLDELYRTADVRWIFVDLRDRPVDVAGLDRLATVRFVGPSTEVWQLRAPASASAARSGTGTQPGT